MQGFHSQRALYSLLQPGISHKYIGPETKVIVQTSDECSVTCPVTLHHMPDLIFSLYPSLNKAH